MQNRKSSKERDQSARSSALGEDDGPDGSSVIDFERTFRYARASRAAKLAYSCILSSRSRELPPSKPRCQLCFHRCRLSKSDAGMGRRFLDLDRSHLRQADLPVLEILRDSFLVAGCKGAVAHHCRQRISRLARRPVFGARKRLALAERFRRNLAASARAPCPGCGSIQ